MSMLIPSPSTRNDILISHIMFLDDLIVFSKSTPIATANLKAFLYHFVIFSILEVDWAKISTFFSNCPQDDKEVVIFMLGVIEGHLPVLNKKIKKKEPSLFKNAIPLKKIIKLEIKDLVLCIKSGAHPVYTILDSFFMGFYLNAPKINYFSHGSSCKRLFLD